MKENCYKKDGVIYFKIDKIPSKNETIYKMGVRKKSFAGNLVGRVYDYYFSNAINIAKEYKKYYSKEFGSLEDFLEQRYNLDSEQANLLSKDNYSMKECSVMSIERDMETLNEDEDFKLCFSEVIGGIRDEDPIGIYYK